MYGTLIAAVTVGSGGAASISFSSIPATYTDLVLVATVRSDQAITNVGINVYFNGDSTGANYTSKNLYGSGSATASFGGFSGFAAPGTSNTASTFSNGIMTIPNYAGSTSKSISVDDVYENNGTAANQYIRALSWSGTAAITSISITPAAGNFVQYSAIYLYGLTKGTGGATAA